MAYARKVLIKKPNLKTYNIFLSGSGAHSDFFSSLAIEWILLLMCTKQTASKQVSKKQRMTVEGINKNNYFRF